MKRMLAGNLIVEVDAVDWNVIIFLVLWMSACTAVGAWFMNHEAGRFQREIDALDSLAGADSGAA